MFALLCPVSCIAARLSLLCFKACVGSSSKGISENHCVHVTYPQNTLLAHFLLLSSVMAPLVHLSRNAISRNKIRHNDTEGASDSRGCAVAADEAAQLLPQIPGGNGLSESKQSLPHSRSHVLRLPSYIYPASPSIHPVMNRSVMQSSLNSTAAQPLTNAVRLLLRCSLTAVAESAAPFVPLHVLIGWIVGFSSFPGNNRSHYHSALNKATSTRVLQTASALDSSNGVDAVIGAASRQLCAPGALTPSSSSSTSTSPSPSPSSSLSLGDVHQCVRRLMQRAEGDKGLAVSCSFASRTMAFVCPEETFFVFLPVQREPSLICLWLLSWRADSASVCIHWKSPNYFFLLNL